MKNICVRQDREQVQNFSLKLLDAYLHILAQHLDLPFRSASNLAKEMSWHAISAFIDTAYRLKHHGIRADYAAGSVLDFQELFEGFFSDKTVQAPLGTSRILRCDLANIMLLAMGDPPLFRDIQGEPDEIYLENIDLPLAPQEKYWQIHYKLTNQIPNGLVQYSKAHWNQFRQLFRDNLVRIGYIKKSHKYMNQLPDIQWVQLDIKLDNYFGQVQIKKRKKLYDSLRKNFLEKTSALSGWDLVTGTHTVTNEFIELLLAFIILESESLLSQTERLKEAVQLCERYLQTMNLKAIFSEGNWFRFKYAVLATAARQLELPIIEFQMGGALMYRTETATNTSSDIKLVWGDLKSLSDDENVIKRPVGNPSFSSDPAYARIRNGRSSRIMYTPIGLSDIFSIEKTLSATPLDMEDHRQWVSDLFQHAEGFLEKIGSVLYIKIKGFGYTMLRNHESMLFPRIRLENVPVRYLKTGISIQYLSQMDLHIFCGPSTTFAESLNRNIPSICLWNLAIFELKPIYKDLFTEMNQAGIIVTNADSFCTMLSKRLATDEWWCRETQLARNKYCENMAFSSDDWVRINNAAILDTL